MDIEKGILYKEEFISEFDVRYKDFIKKWQSGKIKLQFGYSEFFGEFIPNDIQPN